MRTLAIRYKKKKRKASHLLYLRGTIANLHNEIVQDVLKNEFIESKITNKARLLKKYNRRLKWLLY